MRKGLQNLRLKKRGKREKRKFFYIGFKSLLDIALKTSALRCTASSSDVEHATRLVRRPSGVQTLLQQSNSPHHRWCIITWKLIPKLSMKCRYNCCKSSPKWLDGVYEKASHSLKNTQNVAFEFLDYQPIFVLLKLTCLVTLFDRKLQFCQKLTKMNNFWHFK